MHMNRLRVRGLRASASGELELRLPGRFAVLVGANGAGKTTLTDAMYLAHDRRFPQLPPLSSAALGGGDRDVEVEYSFEADVATESPLGLRLQAQSARVTPGTMAVNWTRTLERSLGTIRARRLTSDPGESSLRLVHLPASRNPVDELARRETRVLVELLRAQQQNRGKGRDLTALRGRASGLLERLASDELLQVLEARVSEHLRVLSAGVTRNWPYVRGQVVDDRYLARVLELMLATIEGRENALPLDVVGLGYVNLLHIAVTLAAIPDSAAIAASGAASTAAARPGGVEPGDPAEELADADRALHQARAEAESAADSFFPDDPFHVTVVIEEPEAHLHPQLQHSLVRYLRRQVQQRPELQVILSSHATDIVTSCNPEEIVVVRRDRSGRSVCRAVAEVPLGIFRPEVLRKARLHMDASRSASLFAERLLLVEGVTEAAVLRELGWSWAAGDPDKEAFIDALSIVPMGTKVGPWAVRLLATRSHELCARLAVLRDSDLPLEQTPQAPTWADAHDPDVLLVEHCHPTLEPELTRGNEGLVAAALDEIGVPHTIPVSVPEVLGLFRSSHRLPDGTTQPAGAAAGRKGEFAEALAARFREARDLVDGAASVPDPVRHVFDFLYEPLSGLPDRVGDAPGEPAALA